MLFIFLSILCVLCANIKEKDYEQAGGAVVMTTDSLQNPKFVQQVKCTPQGLSSTATAQFLFPKYTLPVNLQKTEPFQLTRCLQSYPAVSLDRFHYLHAVQRRVNIKSWALNQASVLDQGLVETTHFLWRLKAHCRPERLKSSFGNARVSLECQQQHIG